MKMNARIWGFIVAINLFGACQVFAEVDYKPLNEAATNFLSTLETLSKQVPEISDEAGTIKALDTWTQANLAFCDAASAFAKKYPEIIKLKEPPTEFVAAYSALSQIKTKYAVVPKTIGTLLQKFGGDAGVRASIQRFQESLVRIGNMGKSASDNKKNPSGGTKEGNTK